MPAIPVDGRLTSQNPLSGPLTGGEVMYIVSPGNATAGNSYKVTTDVLAAFFGAFPALNTELITAGATLATPYAVLTTDTRILFNKTLASASYAVCPSAGSMVYGNPILFKDLKGDAATNNITISFSGGQLCDGLSTLVIASNYGFIEITPTPTGNAWYVSG